MLWLVAECSTGHWGKVAPVESLEFSLLILTHISTRATVFFSRSLRESKSALIWKNAPIVELVLCVLEVEMETPPSILSWRILWTEQPEWGYRDAVHRVTKRCNWSNNTSALWVHVICSLPLWKKSWLNYEMGDFFNPFFLWAIHWAVPEALGPLISDLNDHITMPQGGKRERAPSSNSIGKISRKTRWSSKEQS